MQINSLLKLKHTLSKEAYEQAVRLYKEALNKNPGVATHRKRSAENAICESLLAGQEIPRFARPVRISIHTVRKYLPRDVGAISYKAVLDSVVSCGVLHDDNRKIIPEEIKCTVSKGPIEYTEILIEEIQP